MYYTFFGVTRPPFHLTADPDFLYLTCQHQQALGGVAYAILARKGLVVLTGAAGTGKTTLLAHILQQLPPGRIRSSPILNPTLSVSEFLEAVLMNFGIENIPVSKTQRLANLYNFLLAAHRADQACVLIVDEAHKASLELLEEIRLLSNFEAHGEKLLQVALVGQSELDAVLDSEGLGQLKQRVAHRMSIGPLAAGEVGAYIQHRWCQAGGSNPPFSAEAVACIGSATAGIPRLINVTCDNALIEACAEGSHTVETRHILGVCREMHFPAPALQATGPIAQARRPVPQASAPAPEMGVAASEDAAGDFTGMRTLERYSMTPAPQRSLLRRIFSRSPRMETA